MPLTSKLLTAINHPPQFGLGVRQLRSYDLALTRYNIPEPLPPSSYPGYQLSPPSPRFSQFHYRLVDPIQSVGPGDNLPVVLSIVLNPKSSRIQLHSVSATLERRMDLFEASGSTTPPEVLSGIGSVSNTIDTASTLSHSGAFNSSTTVFSGSNTKLSRKRSASPPVSTVLPAKSVSTTIISGETAEFQPGNNWDLTAVVNLPLPAKPPPSQWPIGESLRTDLAVVRFFLRIKVCYLRVSYSTTVRLTLL